MQRFGIGQPVRRVEDQRFITGRGQYVDDIVLRGQCFGALVCSPHAHARIVGIDTAAAEAAPRRGGPPRRRTHSPRTRVRRNRAPAATDR